MIILGIESSCDETAIALVKNGTELIAHNIHSQTKLHREFGGVVPELASRQHVESIHPLLIKTLEEGKLSLNDIDAVAVTQGPGLEGALLVGITTAKNIAFLLNKPLIAVNHLVGHIYAHYLTDTPPKFPYMALLVSGGHTQLVHCIDHGKYELVSATRDDACGEAFDKVAKLLGLGYPGGPVIEKLAKEGNQTAFKFPIALPASLEFSFSGLKTAVLQTVKNTPNYKAADVAASFQYCVIQTLLKKSLKACNEYKCNRLVLCGGVVANRTLVQSFQDTCSKKTIHCHSLQPVLSTDNAAMIASAAFFNQEHLLEKKQLNTLSPKPSFQL